MELWSAKTAAIGLLPVFMAASGTPAMEVRRHNEDAYVAAGAVNVSVARDLWAAGRNSSAAAQRASTKSNITTYTETSVSVKAAVHQGGETPILKTLTPPQPDISLEIDNLRRVDDATTFLMLLDAIEWRPSIWADEGELVFEWIGNGKHAIVSFEGDGKLGYTLLRSGVFSSGESLDPPVTILPDDLREYLFAA